MADPTDADGTLQKQDLLLKMLNMTTSDNDNMALVAIRKANNLLKTEGWTWQKLLEGKITIVEDPFKDPSPFGAKVATPTHPFTFTPSPPPPPKPAQSASKKSFGMDTPFSLGFRTQISTRGNNYANSCYCCGDHVDVQSGYIFKPSDFTANASSKWECICNTCNKKVNDFISRTKAPRTGKVAGAPISVNLNSL